MFATIVAHPDAEVRAIVNSWSIPLQAAPIRFGRVVACSLRYVASVVGVRAVRFHELVKAVCIGPLHRRTVQLEVVSP